MAAYRRRLARNRRPRKRMQGSAAERGYGYQHQKTRLAWKPVVNAGMAFCHAAVCLEPDRWIRPGTPWHLGHTPDRTAWTGPEHARCNLSDGATRGNAQRSKATVSHMTARQPQPSRAW